MDPEWGAAFKEGRSVSAPLKPDLTGSDQNTIRWGVDGVHVRPYALGGTVAKRAAATGTESVFKGVLCLEPYGKAADSCRYAAIAVGNEAA